MTFTREDWQADLLDKTKDVMPKLKQMGITSGYAIIAAAALLPIVMAGPAWFPVLVSLVGNVGASLITNQIQGAKDEVDIAQKLQSLPDNHPLNMQIRLLLEKLDAVNVVSQGLPEADWIRLERLLDAKLAQISTSARREPTFYAPIIRETTTNALVRQIIQQHVANIWWANKTHGKARVSLNYVPTVLYKARCSAVVQVDRKDQNANVVESFRETTNPFPVKLILFLETGLQTNNVLFQEELYKSINGLAISNEIDWAENPFAGWGHRFFNLPVWKYFSRSFSSNEISYAEKNIGFWFGDKSQCDTKPSTLMIQKEKIIDEARLKTEEILEKRYNRISGKTLLRVRYSDEELDFAQYPFYFVDVASPGFAKMVIDGLTGDVRYSYLKPNWKAKVFYSIATVFISIVMLLFCVGISMLAIYLWKK